MNAAILFLAREFPAWVLQATWQATAMAGAVVALQLCLGARLRARWRNALWAVVIVRLLLPALPPARISVYNIVPSPARITVPVFPRTMAPIPAESAAVSTHEQLVTPSAAQLATSTPMREPTHWPALPWIWITGMMLLGATSLIRHARMRRRLSRLGVEAATELVEQFESAKRELGVRHATLLVSEAASAPCVTGLWRATVVLPAGIESKLTPADIRMVFLHELGHVKRGDLWAAWAGWLAGMLHWFNPAAALIQRLARRDRELACDEWVLRHLENPSAYGEALIRFLGYTMRPEPGTIGIIEGRAALMQRVRRIAAYHRPTLIGTVGGCALLAIIGAVTLTAADREKANTVPVVELPSSPSEWMVQAIAADDTALAEKALNAGLKLDAENDDWRTGQLEDDVPVMRAVSAGRLDILKLLVAHGASITAGTTSQTNPAEMALIKGHVDIAEYLHDQGTAIDALTYAAGTGDLETVKRLTAGGKPSTLDGAGNAAAGCGQVETLGVLIDKGANVAKAFRRAASTGAVESLKYLVAHGANLDALGFDALYQAAANNQTKVTAYLLRQKVNPNYVKREGDSPYKQIIPPINKAAEAGAMGSLKLLLDAGADPNSPIVTEPTIAVNGETPLFSACARDDAEIAEMLLDHGANIEATNTMGMTPVLEAAASHAPRCLALLIDRGANLKPAEAAAQGRFLIDEAEVFVGEDADRPELQMFGMENPGTLNREMATMKLLLDRGLLDVNTQDQEGNTPLTTAIINGQTAWVETLLKSGAKVNFISATGKTPLIIALLSRVKEDRYYALLNDLLQRGADPNLGIANPIGKPSAENFSSALKTAISIDKGEWNQAIATRRKLAAMMLAHGTRFQVAEGSDAEKMQLAAVRGDRAGVDALLARGVSPDSPDSRGWTPLLSAMALDYDGIFQDLLKAGASAKARDASGENAMHFAAEKLPDVTEIELLLDKGVDINSAGGTEMDPYPIIYSAISMRNPDLLRSFLKRGANPNMLPLPEEVTENWLSPLEQALTLLEMNSGDEKMREIVTMLIAAGADMHPERRHGRSLLIFPVMTDNLDLVKFLLAAGMDPKKDADGGKAVAEQADRRGNKEMKALIAQALAKN